MSDVTNLRIGDARLENLLQAVIDLLHERGEGLPIPSLLGVLDLAKDYLKAPEIPRSKV